MSAKHDDKWDALDYEMDPVCYHWISRVNVGHVACGMDLADISVSFIHRATCFPAHVDCLDCRETTEWKQAMLEDTLKQDIEP
jgi:hypothetical protein